MEEVTLLERTACSAGGRRADQRKGPQNSRVGAGGDFVAGDFIGGVLVLCRFRHSRAQRRCRIGGILWDGAICKCPGRIPGAAHADEGILLPSDAAVAEVNQKAEGNSLDPIQVKAVFFALCFGDDILSRTDAEAFVACFCETETRVREETGETYEVAVPLPMEEVYAQLSAWRGRAVTAEERSNAVKIYSMVMGSAGGGTFNGAYEPGGNAPMELEASMFTDPPTKNSADLAIYAANAWNSGWGYVWGTFGQVLTPELLQYKISQYPEGVGDEADFIRSHWLNRRTTDCVGLIKGYGWLNAETMEIQYGSNDMPDVGADGMYYNAGRKGSIETMPDTPGLAVWKSGHIGVYIGNGEVIEAMDTRYGVVKTKLQGRGWSHWLEVPGIKYD